MERVAFLIESTGQRLDCLVNPETLVCRRASGLRRRTLLGREIEGSAWSDDVLVWGGGTLNEMQLDLLFDTSLVAGPAVVDDVQSLTRPFWSLAEQSARYNGRVGVQLARFVWGKSWNVLGVVSSVAERFECFLPNGAPQRSWLRMTFVRVTESAGAAAAAGTRQTTFAEAPLARSSRDAPAGLSPALDAPDSEMAAPLDVHEGRLDQLAFALTGDSSNWRALASARNIDDPMAVDTDASSFANADAANGERR